MLFQEYPKMSDLWLDSCNSLRVTQLFIHFWILAMVSRLTMPFISVISNYFVIMNILDLGNQSVNWMKILEQQIFLLLREILFLPRCSSLKVSVERNWDLFALRMRKWSRNWRMKQLAVLNQERSSTIWTWDTTSKPNLVWSFQVWLKNGIVSVGTVSILEINSNVVQNARLQYIAVKIVKEKTGKVTKNFTVCKLKLNSMNLWTFIKKKLYEKIFKILTRFFFFTTLFGSWKTFSMFLRNFIWVLKNSCLLIW